MEIRDIEFAGDFPGIDAEERRQKNVELNRKWWS